MQINQQANMSIAPCIQTLSWRHYADLHAAAQTYLLVCVGRDNGANYRSCWELHRFYRGDRGHSSWDSGYWSPQNFLLKPGVGAGRHHNSEPCTNHGTLAISRQRLHSCQPLLTPVPAIPKGPISHDRAICRAYLGLEVPGLVGFGSGTSFIAPCRGPYRAISASISFRRSSPLLPGMPTPGPWTTGPPAPGSPGAGPAPAIAAAFAVAGTTASAPPPPPVPLSTPGLRQCRRPRMTLGESDGGGA